MARSLTVTPDTEASLDFLHRISPSGTVHLVAIDGNGRVEAATFGPLEERERGEFIRSRQGDANLYFHVNELRLGVADVKAKKSDVARAVFLHVDVDDPESLDRLKGFDPGPTAIVFSGGGYHAYWRLNEPSTDLDRVEAINRAIASEVGGDNCHNIDRIMRLPGTINLPSAKKRAAGREATLATVAHEDWLAAYSLDDFELPDPEPQRPAPAAAALAVVPAELAALPDAVSIRTRSIIELGDDPERPRGSDAARFPSRSEAVFFVACDLARVGVPNETIAGILINPALAISRSVLERRDAKRYALRQAAAAAAAAADGWPDPDKQGRPRSTMRNATVAARRLGLNFGYDLFRQRKMIGGSLLEEHQGEISDDAVMVLRGRIIDQFGFDPRSDHVRDAVTLLCLENAFHPICDELNALSWDSVERLDQWMHTYLGAEHTALNAAISRIILIAAVRRIRQPGVKFDQIVVLEGPQGSGKSTAVRILAGPGNHSDQEILTLDAKAQIEMLDGVWFYELGEVEGMNRAEVNKIKAFASRQVDRARMAYAHFAVERKRQAVFIGTTNDDKYLRDQTGNRRFWPVKTGAIDLYGLARDRDQLLAEAAHREAAGETIELPQELWGAAAEQQAKRLEDDPWLDKIETAIPEIVGGFLRLSTNVLLLEALEIPLERQSQGQTKRLAVLMKKLGWSPAKFHVGKKVIRGYQKPVPEGYDPGPSKPPF